MKKFDVIERRTYYPWFGTMTIKCPGCGDEINYSKSESIEVNCETKGDIIIDGLWRSYKGCTNPLCGWSKAK